MSSLTPSSLKIESRKIFFLIDSLLPYPICFYYQILPLALNEQYLILGMVNPKDKTALHHVRNVLNIKNRSLKIKTLNPAIVEKVLAAYLQHREQENSMKIPDEQDHLSVNERATLEVSADDQKKLRTLSPPLPTSSSQKKSTGHKKLRSYLRPLKVETQYLFEPIEELKKLSPSGLLLELLGRVVQGGIGRLYFERHLKEGRIICSQNGVLRETLDGLGISPFQQTLNELKRLANLPMTPIHNLRKVEIARCYEEDSLLIRINFITSRFGEEATLQILRGQALEFYQKKQMDRLGQEALQLAQQLDRKLKQIYLRTHYNPAELEVLSDLDQLVHHLQKQVDKIRH